MAGRKRNMPTQRERVLDYIKQNGSITRLQAVYDLGVMELAARICELECEGYKFDKTPFKAMTRYGYEVSCTSYSLK